MTNHETPSPTAVWVDGDPLMEAIAAAVWEQCGRSDSGSCVEDDPRTIAAVAAAVSVPPPAPRADDLRCAVCHRADDGSHPAVCFPPAPADRAAVLRWAADRLAEEIQRGARFSHEDARQPGLAESVMLLRRWADEAQGAAEYSRALATPPSAEAAAYIRERLAEVGDDHSCAESGCSGEPGPVAGEQQNETPEAEIEHLRDRLASCRERVGIAADKAIAAEDAIARARQARRRLTSALIAVEPLLTEPYPDDPRWTPWTRFVGPALKELSDALRTGPAAHAPSRLVAEEQNETPEYDPRAWETYHRDAGCGCTAPDPADCTIPHGTGAWLCVCHRLSGPPLKKSDPPAEPRP